MSFGKKGVVAGQAHQPARRVRKVSPFQQPANQAAQNTSALSDAGQAFIEAERKRGGLSHAGHGETEYSGPVPSYSGRSEAFAKPSFFDQFAPREPSMVVAYICWFALSNVSAHRFYLGAHKSALQQIALLFASVILGLLIHPSLFIGMGIWALWVLADVFLIPGLHRQRMKQTGYDTHVFT